jgi:murein DD-endopeptidase MepM/ murein hydrolase activator NlpD/ribosome-associated toxin RatA of RatAB toxin-antitoxin module
VQKITLFITFLITLALSATIVIFFEDGRHIVNAKPQELYQVYLGGTKVGVIKSKSKLEAYIDNKQKEIKEKYNVKNVYPPKDLYIQKHISYNDEILSEEEVYELIKEKNPFTIKGYTFKIKRGEKEDVINVISEELFMEAATKLVEAFVPSDEYKHFRDEQQKEITTTGKIIEDLYIPTEQIKKKEAFISTDEKVFIDVNELAKYLLFGTLEEPDKYIVKAGDTIEQISFNHKLGTEEFLVVNPEFSNANSLLFPGQEVSVGLINPVVDVVVEEHIVEDQIIKYDVETRYDNTLAYGVTNVNQEGIDGIQRVIQKRQTTNGVITNVQIDRAATTIIREPIKKVVVKGTMSIGGGTVTISSDGRWVWPTDSAYVITSHYGWRWLVGKRDFHEGIDISGTGYGSPIRTARAGTVIKSSSDKTRGEYIIIAHDNNYYTTYLHLSEKYVNEGQTVIAGQVIGGMGNSGNVYGVTGTHLHFGVYVGEPYVNGSKSADPEKIYR